MSLHALAYCERLFYLEEVEGIRLADAAVYAGRRLHREIDRAGEEQGEWVSWEISSETMGLTGKVDSLRRQDGSIVPYEHKRGRPRRDGRTVEAWPADRIQVAAYAMLLEEATGKPVPEGRIRYHAANVTVRVPIDASVRASVNAAIERARCLRNLIERPPVTANDRLCIRCSLAPVCLPEEERLACSPDWEPVRLLPPSRDRKIVHVVEPAARISRSGNTLKVSRDGDDDRQLLAHETGALVLHGYPQITTQALHFCARNDIAVHWLSHSGQYVGGLTNNPGRVQQRLRQYRALSDSETRLSLARRLALARSEGMPRYLLRATRGQPREPSGIGHTIDEMRRCLRGIARADNAESVRGFEGLAGRAYFAAWPHLLSPDLPESLKFSGRNRRPPRDRINALLGFGYGLLYQAVMQSVLAVGLEPAFGFYHTPRSAAQPLVLDLMELFRMPVWDIPLIGSLNRKHWDEKEDFEVAGQRVWLSAGGRRKAVALFEKRLEETWKHPVVGYSLSYYRHIELEVRLLEKEWTGEPGLFARMRLR
jgi:CRISPR-associated protein Cas1